MAQLPKSCMRLIFREHIELRPNAARRIIDPRSGFQFEITEQEVNYICPICRHVQVAPFGNDIEYFCPKCKWHYLVLGGELLVVWDPSTVGVPTVAFPPGKNPAETMLDAAGGHDPERNVAAYKDSQRKFLEAGASPDFAKQTQVQVKAPPDNSDITHFSGDEK